MSENQLSIGVRSAGPRVRILDLVGELSGTTGEILRSTYAQTAGEGVDRVILNFSRLAYMNSLGIGMLVSLLVRARRDRDRLAAFGLSDHYRELFALTRLDQVIPVASSEEIAVRSADPDDLPEREY